MFTLEQIHSIHEKLGTIKTLVQYVTALSELGVEKSDTYLTDGHSVYFGIGGYQISSEPVHEPLRIADRSNRQNLLNHLALHEAGKTDYITMSKGLAASGVEKWTINTHQVTIAYYDKQGQQLLVESIQ